MTADIGTDLIKLAVLCGYLWIVAGKKKTEVFVVKYMLKCILISKDFVSFHITYNDPFYH